MSFPTLDEDLDPGGTSAPPTAGERAKQWGVRLLLAAWALAMILVGGFLLAGHLLTLPKPEARDARLTAGILSVRTAPSEGRWLALHVINAECVCSKRVLEHLLSRKSGSFAIERVVLVDGDQATAVRIRAAGYEFEALSGVALEARYGITGAPLMVVVDPTNAVRYLGGYSERNPTAKLRDEEIFGQLAKGETPATMPVFGCAISKNLQESVDPLGLNR